METRALESRLATRRKKYIYICETVASNKFTQQTDSVEQVTTQMQVS